MLHNMSAIKFISLACRFIAAGCGLLLLTACLETLDVETNNSINSLSNTGLAGSDKLVAYSSAVSLTSSMSPSEVLSYQWSQLAGESVLLIGANGFETSFIAPASDSTLEFQLDVVDINEDHFYDRVNVYVMDLPIVDMSLSGGTTLDVDTNNEVLLNILLSKEAVLAATAYIEFSGSAVLGTHYSVSYSSTSNTTSTTSANNISALNTDNTQVLSIDIPVNSTIVPIYISANDASMVNEGERLSLTATVVGANNADYDDVSVSLDLINSNHSPVFTSASSHTVTEGKLDTKYYATATDVDGDVISYNITGGEDADLFTLDNASGHLQFIALTAYDEAAPENNVYELIISASDGTYVTEQSLSLNVVADYEELAPIFSTAESVGVDEGIIDVFYTLEVYDPNGDTIGTTISGEHTQYFEIEETSTELSSKSFDFKLRSLTDYENPQVTDNTYYITFTAADYKFTSDFTLTVHLDDLAELAPNLNLTEQSSDSLRVIFDSVSGMDAYTLYYSDDLACIEELCADTAIYTYSLVTGTSFTDLTPITPYYFRTTGYYTASGHAQLSEVYGYSTLFDIDASSVEINVVSDTSVNVTWDLQTEAEDIDYRLYVYGNSGCSDDQLIESDNDCEIFSADIHDGGSALIENLVAGSAYHFAILAINDVYGGWYPDTPSITTPPLAVDGSTLKEQNLASTSLTLNWAEPDNGDDTSYEYNIIVCNPDCTFKFQASTSSNSSQAISNLQPGTAHQFLISSLAASYEVNSSALSLTTVPEAVSLNSESDDTSISLDWSSTINGAATSYNIYRVCLDEADNCSAGLLTSTSETSHIFTDLNIGELYSLIVGANAGGLETNSSTASLSTMPSTPANFSIEPLESNNEFSNLLFLSWSAAAQADGYRIYDQDDVLHKSISDATETNTTIDHPTPGNNHSYYVVAYNEAGESAKTETITTTTLPRQDLDDDLAYSFTETKLDISWDSANGDGVEYIVNLFTCPVAEATCSLQSQNSAGNQQSITIEDLLPANSYEFNISIISNVLNLETASYSYISTPAAVEALSAFFEPDGSAISLNWDNSNSDVASLSIYRYLCPDSSFSSCSAPQQIVADLDYTSVFYSDTDVALDEYYQYSISVIAGSAEAESSIVNVERAQATTPEEFSASVSEANVVSLQWQAASYYTSYTLTRTDGLGNSLSLSAPAIDATSASDSSNIIPGELYAYELTAVNSFSQSEPAQSSITSNPEVSSASITSIGADSVSVDITSANGSMAVYQLHVFDCTSGSCVSVVDGTATSELSASATEIPAGSDLQLNLSTSANSTSVSSANQEFTTLPAAVTELSVDVAIDGSAIDLNWESSNGSATELKVYRYVCTDATYSNCAFEQLLATLDYTITSYTDNQFELAPYYQYSLGAVTGANEANSSVVNAVKPEVAAASNFIAAVQGSTTVDLSWDAASNHSVYSLSVTDNLDTLAAEQSLSADQISHTLSTLIPGEFYTFELNASNSYTSSVATATAYTDIEPIAFTGFSAISSDAATINLDNPNGSTVAHTLNLELCGTTCEPQDTPSVGSLGLGANQWQLDELEAGSQYQLTWQVDNHDSSASQTTTLDPLYTHPTEPTDFAVLEVDSTSANIGFQSVNGASSSTSAHLLDCSSDPCADSTDTNPSFTALGNSDYSYQLSGLVPGSDYSLSLSVSNNGVTATSTAFDFTTWAAAPTNLDITEVGIDNFVISWDSSNGDSTEYSLELELCTDSSYADCSPVDGLPTLPANSSEYNITGLDIVSYYQIRVGAQSSAGAKAISSTSLRYFSASGSAEDLAVAALAADGVATLDDHSEVDISFTGQLNLDQNTLVLYLEDCATGTCVATSAELRISDLVTLGSDSYQYTIEGLRPGSDYNVQLGISVEYGELGASQTAELNSSVVSFTTDYQYPESTLLVDLSSTSVLDLNVNTENGAGVVHHYALRRCLDQECSSVEYLADYDGTFVVDASALPYQFSQQLTGLPPGSLYQVLVVARPPEQDFDWTTLDTGADPCRIASFSSASGLVPQSAYYDNECAHRFTEPAAVYDFSSVTYQQSSDSYELNYTSDNGVVGIDYHAYILHCSSEQSEGEQLSCVHNGSPYLLDASSSSATLPVSGLDAESYLQVIVQTTRDVGYTSSDAQELAEVNASAVYFTTPPRAIAAIQIDGVSDTTIDSSWELVDDWAVNFGGDTVEEHFYLSSEICSSAELLAFASACGIVERQAIATATGALTGSATAIDLESGEEIYLTLVRSNAAATEASQSVAVLTQPSPPSFSLSSVTSEDDQATVTISWTDNRSSQDIDYYEVYATQGNCSFSDALANSSNCGGVNVYNFSSSYSGSSYIDPSATETATTYYYYMIAANASGYVIPSSNDRKSVQPQYQQKVSNLYYSIDQDSTTFYWSLPDNNAADDIVISNETGGSIKYLSKNTTSYTYDLVFGAGRIFNIYLRKNGNSGGTVTVIVSEHIPIDVGIQSPSVTVLDAGDARIQFTPVNQDENQSYDYQIFRHPADADTSCSIDPANCEDAVTFSATGLGNEQITYLDELGSHAQDYYYIVREILGSDSYSSYSDSVLAEFDFPAPEITQVFYKYDEELGQLGLTLSWSLVEPGERAITHMELFRYTDSGCNQLPDNYSSCNDPALYIDSYSASLSHTTLRYTDELPTTEEYYYRLHAITSARGSELSAEIRVNPHVTLNDSGISRTVYYPSGDSGYASDCVDDDIVGVADCESGRDSKAFLEKVGSGDESFDYTRIGSDGEPLENQSGSYKSSGNNADGTYWHCVHDNVTGLTWDNNSVISYSDEYHYTEFSEIYTDMNSNAVCGHRDWRIPTVSELISIRDFGDDDDNHSPDEKVAADTGSLVNIQQGRYWTKDAAGDDYYLVDFRLWKQAVQVEAFADDGDHYAIFVRGPNLGGTSGIERYYLHPDHHLLIDNNARINAADTSDLTYGTISWHPCFLGQSYNEATSECSGSPSEYDDWRDAMAAVDVFTTESGDYEYRLPNTKEVQTLLDTGAIEEYGHTLHPDIFKGVAGLSSSKDYYLWTSSGSVEDDDESFAFRIASGECCESVDRNNPDTSDNKTYIILPLFISENVIR